jgi:ABC-2 type transport system permease protein
MIGHQLALIKREIWEHRSIFVTPLVVAIIVTLGTISAIVFVSGFAQELEMAVFGATQMAGDKGLRILLTGFFTGTSIPFIIAMVVLTIFYSLDSLYAERKDKSILFWRSLPVTDAEAVVSKLITAVIVIPLVTVIAIIGTHIINLIITSIWLSVKGGDAGQLIWSSLSLMSDWLAALIVSMASAITLLPFVGWFLCVSAYTKRSPLLMAFLPLALLPLIEWIFLRTHYFADWAFMRLRLRDLVRDTVGDENILVSDHIANLLIHLDFVQFMSSPSVWTGIVVSALLTTGAMYVRRFRDDS